MEASKLRNEFYSGIATSQDVKKLYHLYASAKDAHYKAIFRYVNLKLSNQQASFVLMVLFSLLDLSINANAIEDISVKYGPVEDTIRELTKQLDSSVSGGKHAEEGGGLYLSQRSSGNGVA